MQTSNQVLARRYAQAMFEVALEHKEEDKVRQELSDTYKGLISQLHVFDQPVLAAEKQRALLRKSVESKVSKRTLNFLELLIDKKRFNLLPFIVNQYSKFLDEHKGVVRAQVRAATELSKPEQEALAKSLKKFTGKDVAIEMKLAPELLGGMVVRIGDWVLDGSLQGQLRRLTGRMIAE